MADDLTWGTDNPYVDQLPAAPDSSWTDQLAGAAVGGMVRSRQAVEMAIGGVDWLADPILGKEISESDFNFLKGQRNIPFRAGMRVGEAQRLVSKFDYESVRERARAYGLDSWLGDITAGFVGSFLTDPTQVVGLGAGRALTVGVPALVGTRFATQATWLAGQNIAAGSARFGLTLMPELAFEKTLAGYTGQEYGVKDALWDAVGELGLEGLMLGVDLTIKDGPDLFQKASRIVDRGYEQAKTRWEARKAKKAAPKTTELPTVAETLAGDTQTETAAEPAMAAADELPPVDAYDTAAENQPLYPADPQPGMFDAPLAEVAKELPKTTKSRKKVPHPEVPLEAVMLHTEALNRGENVSPADVAKQLELVEQAAESGQTPEVAPPRLDEGPEYVDPPAAEYSGEQAAGDHIYFRTEEPGVDTATPSSKPQGLYVEGESRELGGDLGGKQTRYVWRAKNSVDVTKEEWGAYFGRKQTYGGEVPLSAGVKAAKKLLGDVEFNRLAKLEKEALLVEIQAKYPDVDWARYADNYERMEAVAGIEARKAGYDSIISSDERVALTDDVLVEKPAQRKAEYSGEQAAPVEQDVPEIKQKVDAAEQELVAAQKEFAELQRKYQIPGTARMHPDSKHVFQENQKRIRKAHKELAKARRESVDVAPAMKPKRKVNAAVSAELIGLGSGLETNSGIAEAVQSLVESEKAYMDAVSKNMPKEQADAEIEDMKKTQKRMKEVAKAAAECVRGGK